MKSIVDKETIASFAAPTGWTLAVSALFQTRYLQTLLGIRQLETWLAEHAPESLRASGLTEHLGILAAMSASTQEKVLSYPSARFWLDVAWQLLGRKAHLRSAEIHLVPHLRDFARFTLAGLVIQGHGSISATVRTDDEGRVSLPGTGLVARPVGSCSRPGPCERASLSVENGGIRGWETIAVARLRHGTELNWLDHDLRLGGRTSYRHADLDPVSERLWRNELDLHFATLETASECLATEVTHGIKAIVPVHAPGPSTHVSGTFQEAPGLVALSLGEPLATLEALVHEYGHQKLNALLPLATIFQDDTGEAAHYSPWRPDPRPLTGLLHAVYSFSAVTAFYLSMFNSPAIDRFRREAVVSRAYQVVRQVEEGLESLEAGADFTAEGIALVVAMRRRFDEAKPGLAEPAQSVRRRLDETRAEHRAAWVRQHGTARRHKAAEPPGEKALETLRALGLPADLTPSFLAVWPPRDLILGAVRSWNDLNGPTMTLPHTTPTESVLGDLAVGHLLYLRGDFHNAARRYAACVTNEPRSLYLWHCYAFALRHLKRFPEALYIAVHAEQLMRQGKVPDPARDMREAPSERSWAISLPRDPGEAGQPQGRTPPGLEAGPWRWFVEATGGGQLPAFMALVKGLKPAMDIWVPRAGWSAFEALAKEFDLLYHVDTCFDRGSRQVREIPSGQLTTTRAAFAERLRDGTEAHVFLALDNGSLHAAVGAGWYPLVINGKLVDKHHGDHDRFGTALGYPQCCQQFFRERNNWNEDNTYYAAFKATRNAPTFLCNPFLRHTMFGLVSYMPCSFDCAATVRWAGGLYRCIAEEFPAYAREIEQRLRKPVLCISELRNYSFDGESVQGSSIEYAKVSSLYPVESTDPLFDLLRAGDRCDVDEGVVRVHRGGRFVGAYQTRGDRHGPECPFIVSFHGMGAHG